LQCLADGANLLITKSGWRNGRRSGLNILPDLSIVSVSYCAYKTIDVLPAGLPVYTFLTQFSHLLHSFHVLHVSKMPMPEQHTILGGKVYLDKRSNSSLWQC
jgi:hypothetical protein